MSMNTDVFSQYESEVRSYCRAFPVVFERAKGSELFAENGDRYIDFFAGAGSLNYGHNPDFVKDRLIEYLQSDKILHGLDMFTSAKREFLKALHEGILIPRGLNYKTQFCGPTGTNAVEAAIKIARKVTGRTGIFSFQGGFHGMTLGALAATGNKYNRGGAGIPLGNVSFMPYPYGKMAQVDTVAYIENLISDPSSGYEKPAALLLETVQAEGGVIPAPVDWLVQIRQLCTRHDILMIVDDIQVGCGRTGDFFSFERANIVPDIVTLSKSISGYGLPMAVVLMKPELDIWKPGEHNGTFRGHQLAFVGGAAAIEVWQQGELSREVNEKAKWIESYLKDQILPLDERLEMRGLGLIWGIDCSALGAPEKVDQVLSHCFADGLVIENAGRGGQVIKLLPPLNIPMALLEEGCDILRRNLIKHL